MGDIKRDEQGIFVHENPPGTWTQLELCACGRPLEICVHGDEPKATLAPVTGHVVIEIGGAACALPPQVAAQLVDTLTPLVKQGTETALVAAFDARKAQLAEQAEEARLALEEPLAALRDQLAALDAEIDARVLTLAAPAPEPIAAAATPTAEAPGGASVG